MNAAKTCLPPNNIPTIMWTCDSCTLENETLVTACTVCGAERLVMEGVEENMTGANTSRRAEKRKAGQLSDSSDSRDTVDGSESPKKRAVRSCRGKAPTFDGSSVPNLIALAKSWDGKQNPTGWLMSEKLDGMRALWDGQGDLWSRAGHKVIAPDWFKKDLPQGMVLDGELFMGRGAFQDLMRVCRRHVPDHEAWKQVIFVVFDAPLIGGGLKARLQAARESGFNNSDSLPFARLHPQTVCRGPDHVRKVLAEVQAEGGEGLMLRKAGAAHQSGRTSDLLKVKTQDEDEALVTGHQKGSGKHSEVLGAL
eukprot:684336-Rhodomonas_salina.1